MVKPDCQESFLLVAAFLLKSIQKSNTLVNIRPNFNSGGRTYEFDIKMAVTPEKITG